MSHLKNVMFTGFLTLACLGNAVAGQFDWLEDLEVVARADPGGYAVKLASRFKVGDVEIKAVLSKVNTYADAYMVLKLGELAHKQPETVIKYYIKDKRKGWGVLAKDLGIKPGSQAFHALKRGHDLNFSAQANEAHPGNNSQHKGKNKNRGKGQNRGRE